MPQRSTKSSNAFLLFLSFLCFFVAKFCQVNRMTHEHALHLSCASAAILFLTLLSWPIKPIAINWSSDVVPTNEADIDAALQDAAAAALENREGTIIVMDAQTGRVRALVNSQLAYEQALMPGSAIKPFTALAG